MTAPHEFSTHCDWLVARRVVRGLTWLPGMVPMRRRCWHCRVAVAVPVTGWLRSLEFATPARRPLRVTCVECLKASGFEVAPNLIAAGFRHGVSDA
jgi:hypothetical protein